MNPSAPQPASPEQNPGVMGGAEIPVPSAEVAPRPAAAPATPAVPAPMPVAVPAPVDPMAAAMATPVTTTAPAGISPAIAEDVDVIEKEWVDAAEQIVAATADDPRAEEEQVENLQIDYMKKRYGKDIKASGGK